MASPERSSGEKNGEGVRNVGILVGVIGYVFLPGLLLAGIALAAVGETYRRTSKNSKSPQQA